MILVAGESLVDLILDPQLTPRASPGGGPFNAARTIARLGQPAQFLGRFSTDPFGGLLAAQLAADGVDMVLPDRVPQPTALAVVALSPSGVPQYWFHLRATASFLLDQAAAYLAQYPDLTALHVGSLGLAVEPMASQLELLVHRLPPSALLLLDPNWRAPAIPDAQAHRARIRRILPRTDILKMSTEDLSFLVPGADVPAAARALLDLGTRCVVVTCGPEPVRAFTGTDELTLPVPPVEVVDTVGAGDAFGGGFLAWWAEHRLTRDSLTDRALLAAALTAAAHVAALTCGRAGAEPPWRHELPPGSGWEPAPADRLRRAMRPGLSRRAPGVQRPAASGR